MLADQFAAAASAARTLTEAEAVSKLLWRAHGQGAIADADASAISEAVEARRARLKGMRPGPLPSLSLARRRPPRSPDRRASIERRRRQAASGALPPALAAHFTCGEAAALAVIARQCQRGGDCRLPVDAIAAMAGTCRTVVQGALREAKRLGLLRVTERRIPGRKSLTNVCVVVDASWRAWLRLGRSIGLGNESATDTSLVFSLAKPAATGPKRAFRGGEAASPRKIAADNLSLAASTSP